MAADLTGVQLIGLSRAAFEELRFKVDASRIHHWAGTPDEFLTDRFLDLDGIAVGIEARRGTDVQTPAAWPAGWVLRDGLIESGHADTPLAPGEDPAGDALAILQETIPSSLPSPAVAAVMEERGARPASAIEVLFCRCHWPRYLPVTMNGVALGCGKCGAPIPGYGELMPNLEWWTKTTDLEIEHDRVIGDFVVRYYDQLLTGPKGAPTRVVLEGSSARLVHALFTQLLAHRQAIGDRNERIARLESANGPKQGETT